MLTSFRTGWGVIFLLSVLICCFGCNSSSGGDSSSSGEGNVGVDWQETAVSVQGEVSLPKTSPLSMSEVRVDLFETTTAPDKTGALQLKAPDGQIVEAYIMLPAQSEQGLPVIYLYTVILPGESDIEFSSEETAVSLLMSRISQEYLLHAGTPKQVKQLIRNNGGAFIDYFTAMLEADPYALRTENLDNVYTPLFESAADACRSALESAASGNDVQMLTSAAASSGGSQLYVRPKQEQYDFVVYEDTTGLLGWDTWSDLIDAGGTMTGELKIENDTMLFAHYQIYDLLTNAELTSLKPGTGIPGMIGMGFHPDILGPQKGWDRLWWAGTAKKDVDFKSTKVTVFTPGVAFSETASAIEKQIGGGLAFRTGVTTIMTIVSTILPIAEDGWESWFMEMYNQGLLTAAADKFAYGDIRGGVEALFWTFCDGTVMQSFIDNYITKYLEQKMDAKAVTSQFFNKFNSVVKKIPITKIGLAVDLLKLVDDASATPGRITFDRAEFPLNLKSAAPTVITKVGPDDPLPRITIIGMGLGDVYFGGELYSPRVYLEAENTKGKEKLINIDESDIFAADEYLYFDLPREWAEIGSDIVGPIYLNVVHSFVCEHGQDELLRLELPHEAHEELFAVNFESAVVITAVSEKKPTRGEEITLIGQGFSTLTNNNSVYFTDHTGAWVSANVLMASSTTLDVVVPDGLEFGPLTVEVELHDESVSNEFPMSLHPKPVWADEEAGTHFDDRLAVRFMQEEDCDIYYSINSGSVKKYTGGAVEIDETSHLYPFARVKVDGANYDSATSDFFYYKCAADEELIDGECVGAAQSNVWVLQEATPYEHNRWNHDFEEYVMDFSEGSWQLFVRKYNEDEVKENIRAGYGSYTVPPSVLAPGETPRFEVSATLTNDYNTIHHFPVGFVDTDIWIVGASEYPLDADGRLDFTKDWNRLTYGGTSREDHVEVRSDEVGDTNTSTGVITLPEKGWYGWAEYMVVSVTGGNTEPVGGGDMGYNYVYRWTE